MNFFFSLPTVSQRPNGVQSRNWKWKFSFFFLQDNHFSQLFGFFKKWTCSPLCVIIVNNYNGLQAAVIIRFFLPAKLGLYLSVVFYSAASPVSRPVCPFFLYQGQVLVDLHLPPNFKIIKFTEILKHWYSGLRTITKLPDSYQVFSTGIFTLA